MSARFLNEQPKQGSSSGRFVSFSLVALIALVLPVSTAAQSDSIYERYTFGTLTGNPSNSGSNDGSATTARFSNVLGVALDSAGYLYVTDSSGVGGRNNALRKISPAGNVVTIAGSTDPGYVDDTGSAARFDSPCGLAVDSHGNVFVADLNNHCIRKVTPAGQVTTFAGSASAGTADGTGSNAQFTNAIGITVDATDNLYVADLNNHNIRKITPAAEVTTFAGSTTGASGSADGNGTTARFAAPDGIGIDSSGTLYVSDGLNHTIRKISPSRDVTTFAGVAGSSGSADGKASDAQFYGPNGLGVDANANVYVVDYGTIRKITPAGWVTTLAGVPGTPGFADGTGADVRFNSASSIAIDNAGYLFVGDGANHAVRRGGPTSVSQLLNISTRAHVLTGENALIGGFILRGPVPKRVLIRAIGPSLQGAGVNGFLADPTLELYDSNGAFIISNDDWKTAFNAGDIQASGIPPSHDAESAILATLSTDRDYTTVVRGVNNTTGIALIEVYDLNSTAASVAKNLSSRGFVNTGQDVMIGGFISRGGVAGARILIRALGPSLSQSAISKPLADPALELRDSSGALIAANDNWRESDEAGIQSTGIPPSDDREAAILSAPPPGLYTAILTGKNADTGVALIEIYYLP